MRNPFLLAIASILLTPGFAFAVTGKDLKKDYDQRRVHKETKEEDSLKNPTGLKWLTPSGNKITLECHFSAGTVKDPTNLTFYYSAKENKYWVRISLKNPNIEMRSLWQGPFTLVRRNPIDWVITPKSKLDFIKKKYEAEPVRPKTTRLIERVCLCTRYPCPNQHRFLTPSGNITVKVGVTTEPVAEGVWTIIRTFYLSEKENKYWVKVVVFKAFGRDLGKSVGTEVWEGPFTYRPLRTVCPFPQKKDLLPKHH